MIAGLAGRLLVIYQNAVVSMFFAFSALTLMVGRQEGHPACKKTEWLGAGMVISTYLSGARCRLACGPADAIATRAGMSPLPGGR